MAYAGGTTHRPLPRRDDAARTPHTQEARPRLTGLDWDALTPTCSGCGKKSGQLGDGALCPDCRGVAPTNPKPGKRKAYVELPPEELGRRFTGDDTRLGRDLADLEATDPNVASAAVALDKATQRLTDPEGHAQPAAASIHLDTAILLAGTADTADPVAKLLHANAVSAIEALRLYTEAHLQTPVQAASTPAGMGNGPAAAAEREAARQPARRRRRSHRGTDVDEAAVVREYLAGDTAPAIAKRHGCQPKRVRDILDRNNIERRDDRRGHSGGRPRKYDDTVIAEVRRLYVDKQLSRQEVAAELGIPYKSVQTIMTREGIPARQGQSGRVDGSATLKQRIAELGATSREIKEWALRQGLLAEIKVGIPPARLVDAYAAAHQPKSAGGTE